MRITFEKIGNPTQITLQPEHWSYAPLVGDIIEISGPSYVVESRIFFIGESGDYELKILVVDPPKNEPQLRP